MGNKEKACFLSPLALYGEGSAVRLPFESFGQIAILLFHVDLSTFQRKETTYTPEQIMSTPTQRFHETGSPKKNKETRRTKTKVRLVTG
ncbi:hypothetical protein CCP3SC1AL1_490001 [Gammaproteobacteria bacterium]